MKVRLTHILMLIVSLCISVGFYFMVRYLLRDLEAQTFQATEEMMVDSAYRMASQLEYQLGARDLNVENCAKILSGKQPELLDLAKIYHLEKERVGLQYYVTDQAGCVIFDSGVSTRVGHDYSLQNDVFKTLRGEYGARSSRLNADDDCSSVLYIAAPVRRADEVIGVLSVYKAQRDVMPFITQRRRVIIKVCIIVAIGTVTFVGAVFFLLYRPIGRLTDYAQAVIDGQRPSLPPLGRGREVNTLGLALRDMRETLEGREYAKNYVQTLTHELKSPLSAIRAASELLEEEMPVHHRQRFMSAIQMEVDRSEAILSRLQQLSVIEGLSELERHDEVRVDELVRNLVREYQVLFEQQQLSLRIKVDDAVVSGDPFLLRSTVQNLFDNAYKYAPPSSVVDVEVLSNVDSVVLSVRNEGEPIPQYAVERIFDRFYSAHGEGVEKGSGLGLALVKEAVMLHHGQVAYDYDDGRHVFTLQLPR